jgi:hypothetical protein
VPSFSCKLARRQLAPPPTLAEPFDAGDADPFRYDEPHREAVIGG